MPRLRRPIVSAESEISDEIFGPGEDDSGVVEGYSVVNQQEEDYDTTEEEQSYDAVEYGDSSNDEEKRYEEDETVSDENNNTHNEDEGYNMDNTQEDKKQTNKSTAVKATTNAFGVKTQVPPGGVNDTVASRNAPVVNSSDIDNGEGESGGIDSGSVNINKEYHQEESDLSSDNSENRIKTPYSLYGFKILTDLGETLVSRSYPTIDLAKAHINENKFYEYSTGFWVGHEIVGGTPGVAAGDQEICVYKNGEWR